MSSVRFPELMRQVGLEEIASIDRDEIAANFMPAVVTGLADGDITIMHEPYTGEKAALYGDSFFGDGRVAHVMLRAALENGMTPGALYDFQGFVAQYYTNPSGPFVTDSNTSAVRVFPEAVTIDNNPLVLPRVPQLVIDYGACLTGRSYLGDQMKFLDSGNRPFIYSPLTRLHFTNQSLIDSYDTKYGEGTAKLAIEKQIYIGREDGIASATDEMIRSQRAFGAPEDIADIVLCTGSQHTTPEELQHGMTNAHTLLREDGMLVIRSLSHPAPGEIGTDLLTEWAFESGFEEKHAIRYEAGLHQLGSLLVSGHFGDREIQTVVLTKR